MCEHFYGLLGVEYPREEGGRIARRNICTNLQNHMTQNPRRPQVCLAWSFSSSTDGIRHTNSVTFGRRRNVPGGTDAVLRRHISDIAFPPCDELRGNDVNNTCCLQMNITHNIDVPVLKDNQRYRCWHNKAISQSEHLLLVASLFCIDSG